MYWLRRAFVGAAMAWPIALLLAAVAAVRPQAASIGYGFALVVYAAGSLICHQRPERSFHLLGAQLPVCARCMGIYVGAAVMACLVLMRTVEAVRDETDTVVAREPGRTFPVAQDFPPSLRFGAARRSAERGGGSPASRTVLLVSALPTAATLLFEWTTGHTTGNWTRAVSGVPLGAAVAWIVSGGSGIGSGNGRRHA